MVRRDSPRVGCTDGVGVLLLLTDADTVAVSVMMVVAEAVCCRNSASRDGR